MKWKDSFKDKPLLCKAYKQMQQKRQEDIHYSMTIDTLRPVEYQELYKVLVLYPAEEVYIRTKNLLLRHTSCLYK